MAILREFVYARNLLTKAVPSADFGDSKKRKGTSAVKAIGTVGAAQPHQGGIGGGCGCVQAPTFLVLPGTVTIEIESQDNRDTPDDPGS
jgi:hypothetical protein